MSKETALVKTEQAPPPVIQDVGPLAPHMKDAAMSLAKSSLIPKALRGNPADVWIVIGLGQELGIGPMRALQTIHVVDGKPSLSADLMVALCKQSPQCEFFRQIESTSEIATYETKRHGDPEPVRLSYTIEQARAADLVSKDNWRKYAASMLRARAKSALARDVYPDLTMGIYTRDELEIVDFPAVGSESGVTGLKAQLGVRQ